MPREGAAILSQVEGLLQQFIALGPDYPGVEDAKTLLDGTRGLMSSLRDEIAAESEQPSAPPEEAAPPEEGGGGESPTSMRGAFRQATEAAKAASAEKEAKTPPEGEQPEDQKRRKAKATY